MINLMLWVALLSALATILILAVSAWDAKVHADWMDKMTATSSIDRQHLLQYSICQVMQGSKVVGETTVCEKQRFDAKLERRSKDR